jgi:hypothetical protein
MEPKFGADFSQVRVHTGSEAAQMNRDLSARAFTHDQDIYFSAGKLPGNDALMAHELTHVVQQTGTIQRTLEMRDVGRGEASGFARLPELLDRLNGISQGLTFAMSGQALTYQVREGGTLNHFDRQMMAFIDQPAVIPLRLTNRHGLLGDRGHGFHNRVDVDAWTSGYVDIDDLLSSDDLGLQSVLVHFIRERSATSNYARRIGGSNFTRPEFNRVHALGIEAEAELLRDYFNDPTIRIVNDSPSPTIRRVFRNSRGDLIRRRVRIGRGDERGVDAMSIDVRTRDGRTHTAEEYRQILAAAQP